jgi:hypothetical protein
VRPAPNEADRIATSRLVVLLRARLGRPAEAEAVFWRAVKAGLADWSRPLQVPTVGFDPRLADHPWWRLAPAEHGRTDPAAGVLRCPVCEQLRAAAPRLQAEWAAYLEREREQSGGGESLEAVPFDDRRLVQPPRPSGVEQQLGGGGDGWSALVLWSASVATEAMASAGGGGRDAAAAAGWNETNCAALPTACRLLRDAPAVVGGPASSAAAAATGSDHDRDDHEFRFVPQGAVKVLRLARGVNLLPHTGPSNGRLTAHLALALPALPAELQPRLRVGSNSSGRVWLEREVLVFDDSFEHSVGWPPPAAGEPGNPGRHGLESGGGGRDYRDVLHFTMWHPQLL